MATTTTTPVKGTNAKPYILAAVTGTLAVAAVITIFFIVLSPARVDFSVTHAGSHQLEDGSVVLALTLAANNTSRRAAVVYQSMFVDVLNHTTPKLDVYSVRASLKTAMPLHQPRLSVENIKATVYLVGGTGWVEAYTSNMTNNDFSVIVTAVVRFKVGSARTRLYDIQVTCEPVKFFTAGGRAKRGGGGATARLQQPVKCL